jgi:hypothetical protein
MANAKLKFTKGEEKKLSVAAAISGVEVEKTFSAGNTLVAEVRYRDPQNLIDLGRAIETINGNELDVLNTPKKQPAMATN